MKSNQKVIKIIMTCLDNLIDKLNCEFANDNAKTKDIYKCIINNCNLYQLASDITNELKKENNND